MEVREPPEGCSLSSDVGETGESESFWRASGLYEGRTSHRAKEWFSVVSELTLRLHEGKPRMPDCDLESSSALNMEHAEDRAPSSVRPQTDIQRTVTCCSDNARTDPEVIYDDVPAENLQHSVKCKADIEQLNPKCYVFISVCTSECDISRTS
ncbi:hypothetical protein JOB18_004459 [Solea senegalensis]|uniref:Uncharacterized protein n=1 Tax=Solea senegalensis TaxID=28829 RepID=A0AAV6SR67_SOLSE|nr:hypothetical protein JOB18_004459 [Solea senegalensis]KAG7519239.1 hypothetical protein JOB18_004459 [Solea senegalensis]